MAYNYPNPCGPCYPYIPQCYPCPPPFPPCIREGPTGPAGAQGSTGPTGCTGPKGIGTAFSTERFTVMLDSDPTLNNIVTYADTLQYGNGTLPPQDALDGQYKIIIASNTTTINTVSTEYVDTNLYDKLRTSYNAGGGCGNCTLGPIGTVYAIEYDYNTIGQSKYANGKTGSAYCNIGLEKVWIGGDISSTVLNGIPITTYNLMYYDYGIQPSDEVSLDIGSRGKWNVPNDINGIVGVGNAGLPPPPPFTSTSSVKALCNDTVNNRMYIGGNFDYLKKADGTDGPQALFLAYYDKSNNVFVSNGSAPFTPTPNPPLPNAYGSRVTNQQPALYNPCFVGADNQKLTLDGNYGSVNCLYYNSAKNQLYVGGRFIIPKFYNNVAINLKNIAIWDFNINEWLTLDGGYYYLGLGSTTVNDEGVKTFAFDQNSQRLYIGGDFTYLENPTQGTPPTPQPEDMYHNLCYFDFINNSYNRVTNYDIQDIDPAPIPPIPPIKSVVNALAYDHTHERLYIGGVFVQQDLYSALPPNPNIPNPTYPLNTAYSNFMFVDYATDPTIFQPTDYSAYYGLIDNGIDGTVNTISIDENCSRVYIGGDFILSNRSTGLAYTGILDTNTNLISYNENPSSFTAGYDASGDHPTDQIGGFNDIVYCSKIHQKNQYLFWGGKFTSTVSIDNSVNPPNLTPVFDAHSICKVQLNTYNLVVTQNYTGSLSTPYTSQYFCNVNGDLVSYLNIPNGNKLSLLSDMQQYPSPFDDVATPPPTLQNYIMWQEQTNSNEQINGYNTEHDRDITANITPANNLHMIDNIQSIYIGKHPGSTGATSLISIPESVIIGYDTGYGIDPTQIGTVVNNVVAIGTRAGYSVIGDHTVAVGTQAGEFGQNSNAVAVGYLAGNTGQGGNSVAIGLAAGLQNQGTSAVAIGDNAGSLNNQGNNSVAIGFNAGYNGQAGSSVAIGDQAGSNSQKSDAVAIGHNAGTNSQKLGAVAIGYGAGVFMQGTHSIAIGTNAGQTGQGDYAVAIGYEAGQTGGQGTGSIAIGYRAGRLWQQKDAVAIGTQAGNLIQGTGSIAMGPLAASNFQGECSIAIGATAGNNNQGRHSIAIGSQAGEQRQGPESVAIGLHAGYTGQNKESVAIGSNAGRIQQREYSVAMGSHAAEIQQGTGSVAIGYFAGQDNQGDSAVAIGSNAGRYTQGTGSVAMGPLAGNNTQGICSIAIGATAGNDNQKNYAVAIGCEAGANSQSGNTIAIGWQAGYDTQGFVGSDTRSIAIGYQAGYDNQRAYSVAIGGQAGLTTQSANSVAIGREAGKTVQQQFSVAIGHLAGQDNQGNSAIAIGENAGQNLQLNSAIAIGKFAGQLNSQGTSSIAIGVEAGNNNQGNVLGFAVAIGFQAGYFTQGPNTVAIGNKAGWTGQQENSVAIGGTAGYDTQKSYCVAIGSNAGAYSQGPNSVAIGQNAGQFSQGEGKGISIAIGQNAGQFSQNNSSIAIGIDAGKNNQEVESIAIGFNAGQLNQQNKSVAIGHQAGQYTQQFQSVAIGLDAGLNTQGSGSIAMGPLAGYNYQGASAVAIGGTAGFTGQGNYAVAIGSNAGANSQGQYSVAIGPNAGVTQASYSIALNATPTALNPTNTGTFIKPIQLNSGVAGSTGGLLYNPTSGEITYVAAKTFVIDHPLESSKYLVHACVEGPEVGVYYRGTSEIIDSERTIVLPDYAVIAKDFTISVTPMYNGKMRLLNSSKVINNKFTVYGEPGEFDWVVFGKRGDINVEPEKSAVLVKGDGPYKYI